MSGFEGENLKTSDLIYLYEFVEGMMYEITGVVEFSFGEYKLCPLEAESISPIFDVSDINSVNTEIFMSHNMLNIKCSIIGEQTFELYNILGERIICGVLDQEISIPVHYIETATYIIKVGNYSQLIVKQ